MGSLLLGEATTSGTAEPTSPSPTDRRVC